MDESTCKNAGVAYTREDYLTRSEPFSEVYQIRNPFEQARAKERASLAAEAVGIRNYKALYKAYCDSLKGELLAACNSTDVQDQPLDLNCGDWRVDEYGVRRGGGTSEQIACQFPVLITKRFENIDTGAEKVELSFRKGGYWRRMIVPCSQYASPRELVKLADAGLGINLRMAADLSDYLTDIYSLNYSQLPMAKSVGRLGWVSEGQFSPFVEGLTYDGGAEYAAAFEATRPRGSLDGWLKAARQFRQQSAAARIVLAASFASVLVKPLGVLPFFVHLWGVDSSTGKTVALMAAASVWASPEMGKYVKTFDGTDVGYERTAAFLNSLPLCIDELQLAKNSRGQVVFNVYRLSQGAGRVRGNRAGGVDITPTWANAILTTGETPLNSLCAGAGAVNRVIEIECSSAHKVVQNGHAIVSEFRRHYGHAGRAFVERLMDGGAVDRAKSFYEAAFARLNSSQTTDKQAMAAALLVTADALATEWLFQDGQALTVEEIQGFLASSALVSLGGRGYEYMCDWVGQNVNRFVTGFNQTAENGDVYGVIEGNWAYVISATFRKAAEDAGYNQQALLSYLKGAGLIRTSGGKNSIAKRIKCNVVRCICLRMPDENPFEEPENEEQITFPPGM